MHTTDLYGGLTLGAFVDDRLVGFSYALPGFDGGPFLLSCGLAVAAGFESRGIGLSLKLAQARHARRAGYELARWTTNALASRALHLYLSKLGARLVRYRADMYADVMATPFPDEVEIEWDLALAGSPRPDPRPELPRSVTSSHEPAGGPRRLVEVDEGELAAPSLPSYSVEVPWDRGALAREAPELARQWLAGVRSAMRPLLAAGYVGTATLPDVPGRRSWVVFDRAVPGGGPAR
jgi:predicted GNAT superfamily acetyltransferase